MTAPDATGIARLAGVRVAVWGPGVEGTAVAAQALARGATVTFVDDGPRPGAGHGVPVVGPEALATGAFDVLVRSPGVSRYRPEVQAAIEAGIATTTATAMFLEDFADARIVGITGSKGKTTTAWLTRLLLEESGLDVGFGGNLGVPVTTFFDEPRHDVYVLEVSSFQAADVTVSPTVGVLTVLAPDHLDWHGGYERYVADKLNLFAHRPGMPLAVNAENPAAVAATADLAHRVRYGHGPAPDPGSATLLLDGESSGIVPTTGLRGAHNVTNFCGAVTATRLLLGTPPTDAVMRGALSRMPVLPARLETIAVHAGVEFVNDALASNPEGTVAALRALAGQPLVVIVGGEDRGVDPSPLVDELLSLRPAPGVVLVDEFGARVGEALAARSSDVVAQHAPDLPAAVVAAAAEVAGGGVVLFSPAAPTPKRQGSYVERGACFRQAVERLIGERTHRERR
ncbi:MAG: UDP-N-acetylmuramoyl-L-alanine--D-glutamate ligase [Acidimicrobiales bacterium]